MYKISDFDKSSKHIYLVKKTLSIIAYMILVPIILYNFTLFVKSCLKPNEIPDFFGYKSFVIISESMEPTIMTGDAIFIKNIKQEELKVNDIVSFRKGNETITHRIIDIIEDDGVIQYKTKGDHNKSEDKEMVFYDEIEGKYQFKINGFGKMIEIIKNKITLVILLVLLVIISACQVRNSKKRLKRKQKRYEYNRK